MAKLSAPANAGFNAGKNFYARPFQISDIVIDPEISKIFKVQDKIFTEISESIKKHGFDKSQPVVVWKGKNILVDGHTRLAAAKELGLDEIPTVEREFEDREEALLYTFERQAIRRNLTSAEILSAAQMIHGRKERDGTGRAAEHLAERLGISPATVYQARAIMMEASEEDLKAVQRGETSIKAVYTKVKKKTTPKPKEKENFSDPIKNELPEDLMILKIIVKNAFRILSDANETRAAGLLVKHFDELLPKNYKECSNYENECNTESDADPVLDIESDSNALLV